jgi:hypothetical protein
VIISFDEPNICYVLNALSLIFALSIDANVNPRSVILFLAVILSVWLGELRNVKHMSIGSSIRFFIYFCDIFYLLSESNYFYNLSSNLLKNGSKSDNLIILLESDLSSYRAYRIYIYWTKLIIASSISSSNRISIVSV